MLKKKKLRHFLINFREELALKYGTSCINEKKLFKFLNSINKNFDINHVGLYYPINSEISPLKLIDICSKLNLTPCLPIINKNSRILNFVEWNTNKKLYPSLFNTMQPKNISKFVFPEIIFVPLLGFDINLNRLGYGKGYYDETIMKMRSKNNKFFLAVGIAYDKQEVQSVPKESHDQLLDYVITEKRVLKKGNINL